MVSDPLVGFFYPHLASIIDSYNMGNNDLRKIICLREALVSVERISSYKVIENFVEHDLPCSAEFSFMTILSATLLHQ